MSSLDAPAVSFWISPSERAVLEVVVRSGTVLLYECGVAYFSTCLDMIPYVVPPVIVSSGIA